MCGFVGTLPGRAAASWRCLSAICICASIAAGLGGLLAGCTTPIKVQRMDPGQVERQLESNVISTGRLSEATRIVLHHENLSDQFETDPEGARASLHSRLAAGKSNSDMLCFRTIPKDGRAPSIHAFARLVISTTGALHELLHRPTGRGLNSARAGSRSRSELST
jgi:hypothetical protein